jgi:tRNA dimethylallyltransferase
MKAGKLLFIIGPTASGKTELALREAEQRGAVILSCDSLCVYRGMDIGTAKPSRDEQARIAHYGLDLAEAREPFSVARYIDYRDRVLAEFRDRGATVVVAGGSGFYLKSFFTAVVDRIEISPAVIRRVEGIRQHEGLDGLKAALRACNPPAEGFPGLDWRNSRRVEKALMRCLASGLSYGALLEAFAAQPEPLEEWHKEVRLIDRPAEELRARNRKRVGMMLDAGLIEEVRWLREQGFEANPSAAGAIGYREVLAYLDQEMTREALAEAIVTHTNQLMRKQRSWFRHHMRHDRLVTGPD